MLQLLTIATQSGYLKSHKRNTQDGNQYPCDQCDYNAIESGNLKRHKESKPEE